MADMSFSHICLNSSNCNSPLKHKFKLFTYSLNKRSLKYKELLDPLHLNFLLFRPFNLKWSQSSNVKVVETFKHKVL